MNRITELKTPADMLRKAKAEFEIMKENTDAYTVFNFFVTALHIKDYVAVYLKIEDDDYKSFSESIRKFSLNEEWDIIDSIGNKGKHFALRKRKKNVEILTKPKLLDGSWKLDGSMKLDG
ncbi:MAG TPA: hypothetical protein PKK94_26530, partial [Leptospiraceae bacterium]|nr:hypothetical protein [Leptospiraceae bacterium]